MRFADQSLLALQRIFDLADAAADCSLGSSEKTRDPSYRCDESDDCKEQDDSADPCGCVRQVHKELAHMLKPLVDLLRKSPGQKAQELHRVGAGDGSRTRNIQLGRLALYQLSYSRPLRIYVTD